MARHLTVAAALTLVLCFTGSPLQGSEKQDLFPGTANWHTYRFYAVTLGTEVSVPQTITILFDNPDTGIALFVFDTSDPLSPDLIAVSTSEDRMVSLQLGLLDGTYEIVISSVGQPTHYHMNVSYGNADLLFRQPNGSYQGATAELGRRQMEERATSYLTRLADSMRDRVEP